MTMAARYPLLGGVRKIAVLRPNAVGDFVFALPALHALKHSYPDAELVLVGKAWHRAFLDGRPGPVDRVVEMPPVPGVGMPAGAATGVPIAAAASTAGAPRDAPQAIARFIERMREERFDLALQMFGGGAYSNPFLLRFGARLTVGARAPDAPALDRSLPYREPVNRRLALLEIAALAGAWPGPLPLPELAVTARDRLDAARALPPLPGERLVLLQPGSTDPRRRWPAQRFALLGDALARQGARIVVNGAADEAALVADVIGRMRWPAVNLVAHQAAEQGTAPASDQAVAPAGALGLGGLCGLIERAALVVSNDTGPLHLALALGVPSVGIFWLTNLLEGMPLRPSGLRAALAVRTRCAVCGQDNLRRRCPHDDSFVDEVSAEEVLELARSALAERG